jgi:hypothetical protein
MNICFSSAYFLVGTKTDVDLIFFNLFVKAKRILYFQFGAYGWLSRLQIRRAQVRILPPRPNLLASRGFYFYKSCFTFIFQNPLTVLHWFHCDGIVKLRRHLSSHKGFTSRAKDWEVVYFS